MKGANPETCIIRLEDKDGQTRGTGFVIGPSLAVTCAHVVEACGAGPGEQVRLAFRANGEPVEAEILAGGWHLEADVAFLRLPEPLPEGVTPAVLAPSVGREGARVRAFGYPEVGKVEGLWGMGELTGRAMEAGQALLQLRSNEITMGFSGGPVWEEATGRVLGMITQIAAPDRYARLGDVAFAVPAETLHALRSGEVPLFQPFGSEVIHGLLADGPRDCFVGAYERLRKVYIPPQSVFKRVRLDRFVGRKWLTAEVDAFLREEDRGYFVLEAGAGLGKTTFLAHLAREQGYVHHFVELAPGPDGIAPGLKNLAAQLVRAWELNPYSVDEVLPDFLQNLLFEAARCRDEIKPGEKIVLVVDALDEAGTPYGQNVLGLPRALPEGIYFIVSQRPVRVPLRVEGPRRVFRLEAEGEANLADMQAYLKAAATWSGVVRALAEKEYTPAQFVETLLRKCRGMWIYLHYVVGEIERGERSPLDLEALPKDVWHYYAQYWERWRERDEAAWYGEVLPLLSTLAAAQEALSLPQLCALSGVTERPGLSRLLREAWRPFLAVDDAEDSPRYRLYHASLREFLDGRTDLAQLGETERSLSEELARATRQTHARIAERYIAAWGGLEAGLPVLREPEQRDLDGGYGLRHFAAHLEEADRAADLHRLLRLEWVHMEKVPYARRGLGGWLDQLLGRRRVHRRRRYENTWHMTRERVGDTDGYLADVERSWRLAEEQFVIHQSLFAIGFQCRYALIAASLNSLAKNVPPALLTALVEQGVWTQAQGLAYARQVPEPRQRAEALAGLAPHLPEALKGEALREALAAARAIEFEQWRAEALAELAPHLPEPLLREALAAARAIEWWRAEALAGLAPHLPEALKGEALREALAAARAIESEWRRAEALAGLAPHLPEPLLREALEAARAIQDEDKRAEALAGLAPRLAELGHPQEALAAARESRYERWRAKALAGLAPHLPEPLLGEALAAAQRIRDEYYQAKALAGLAPHLPEALKGEALREALAAARRIWDQVNRAKALAELAPHLPEPLLREALAAAQRIRDEYYYHQAQALAGLAPRLAELGHPQEALAAARESRYERWRAKALAGLAPHLPEPLLGEALAAAQRIRDEYYQAQALAGLAHQLAELGHPQEALAAVRAIEDEWLRAHALAGLPPRLAELGHPQETLAAARAIRDKGNRADALAGLAPHLPEAPKGEALREALAAARAIRDKDDRTKALAELAPHLPEALKGEALREALAAARAIRHEDNRAHALAGLAPYLPEALLREALEAAREIVRERAQAEALAGLAPRLAELGHPQEALAAVRAIEDEWLRAHALAAGLARHLPEALLREALAAARGIQDEYYQAHALAELAPHLPEALKGEALREALAAARAIRGGDDRARALAWLAPWLAELGHPQEALAAAREIPDDTWGWRARALAELAPHLPETLLGEALAAARVIQDELHRAKALAGLASHLAQLPRQHLYPLWQETLPVLAARTRKDLLADLRALAPVIAALGGAQAMVETFCAIQDVGRWWP